MRCACAWPPVEGAANEELARTLARALGVPTRAVEIKSGHASKTKLVRVAGATCERLLSLVSAK
ncbi:MAG: putative YggU family [Acidobacteriota bacterium]|nr:putative YggU family [Acidobacteriota bacterium]